jgi:hypothetical protein
MSGVQGRSISATGGVGDPFLQQHDRDRQGEIFRAAQSARMMKTVVFLISGKHRVLGSNTLRAEQLCRICKWAFESPSLSFSISYSDEELQDSTIFLTKSYLGDASEPGLERLKKSRNVLCADFLDGKINPRIVSNVDILVASSRSQERHFRKSFAGKPIVHVTHHVDIRVPDITAQDRDFRCAYFGDPQNGAALTALRGQIDIIEAVDPRSINWMSRLGDYNCHYAVRQSQERDGFKPFTKGFLAAHCGAPVIVSSSDPEAELNLGADYPYRWDPAAPGQFPEALRAVKQSYRTRDWMRAVAAMENVKAGCPPPTYAKNCLAVC